MSVYDSSNFSVYLKNVIIKWRISKPQHFSLFYHFSSFSDCSAPSRKEKRSNRLASKEKRTWQVGGSPCHLMVGSVLPLQPL